MYYILRTKVDFTFARAYGMFVIKALNGRGCGMITDEHEGVSVFYCKKKEIIDIIRDMLIKEGLRDYILPDLDHEESSDSVN